MDATPVRLGDEIGAGAIRSSLPRAAGVIDTPAAGAGAGRHRHRQRAQRPLEFGDRIAKLEERTGLPFRETQSLRRAGDAGYRGRSRGQLKALAAGMMNRQRPWMNSGPRPDSENRAAGAAAGVDHAGQDQPRDRGAAMMVCAQVIGNDAAITVGAQHVTSS